ncbi:MAG: hypothetical protein ACXABY_28570 [Candidatus Thorarchaeota archaeon]|jgi:hypothetical protein
MDRFEISCSECSYHKDLLVGSVSAEQTLSDVNEDFACYKLHLCEEGKEILSLDIHDREFDGMCPVHGKKLVPTNEMPSECPKCGASLKSEKRDILVSKEE